MGEIDLAACLHVKRDRDDAGYRQWLSEALTQAEEEAKRDLEEMFPPDEKAPSATENGGPTTAEERSEQ